MRKNLDEVSYSPEELRTAYWEPCIASPSPTLWIPRDKFGFSRHEVMETDSIISITDEGAHLDGKNRIIWDKYDPTLPLRERKILY